MVGKDMVEIRNWSKERGSMLNSNWEERKWEGEVFEKRKEYWMNWKYCK